MSVVTLRDNGFEISMIPMIENLEFEQILILGLSLYETKNNRILIELKTNLLKDVYIIRAKDRKVIEK